MIDDPSAEFPHALDLQGVRDHFLLDSICNLSRSCFPFPTTMLWGISVLPPGERISLSPWEDREERVGRATLLQVHPSRTMLPHGIVASASFRLTTYGQDKILANGFHALAMQSLCRQFS